MSVDHDCSPEIAALIGTSAALAISDIPWDGPIGCAEGGPMWTASSSSTPPASSSKVSELDVTVASTDKKVVMIEAGANEVPDDIMFEAIRAGPRGEPEGQVAFINQIVAEIGKPKFDLSTTPTSTRSSSTRSWRPLMDEAKAAMDTDDKNVREERAGTPSSSSGTSSSWRSIPRWTSTWRRSPTSSRRRSSRPGCWRATGWTAAPRTRSVPWPPRWACCPGSTAPACSPAARPRCSPSAPWTPSPPARSWTPSGRRTEKRYMHHYNFPAYSVGEARARPVHRPP